MEAERAATARQLEELKASLPTVATPVRSQAAADKLADKAQLLDILASLQVMVNNVHEQDTRNSSQSYAMCHQVMEGMLLVNL